MPTEAETYLLSLPRFSTQGGAALKPGLDRIRTLLRAMGDPQTAYDSVHVAGTNGKGSTASIVAAIATAAGRRVGLHTSPHLFRLHERLRLDGVEAPDAWLDDAVERYRATFASVAPSFFEATVALSLLYFAEAGADLAVVEVGLGGRLDATNILEPALTLITYVGYDHTELLGTTLDRIAREKAGIVKPGVPLLTAADRPPEVLAVLEAAARAAAAPFHLMQHEVERHAAEARLEGSVLDVRTPLRHYPALYLGLPGLHQQENALLALRAAELLLPQVQESPEAVYAGCRDVRRLAGLRGRLEVIQRTPLVVADVGHNAEGLATALAFMAGRCAGRLFVSLGVMRDKDVPRMAALLAHAEATVFPVHIEAGRALEADALARLLSEQGVAVAGPGTVAEGVAWFRRVAAPEDALLVTGSHQVVAQLPPF